jgi:hypothetical protein
MITLTDYFAGRDKTYAKELTANLSANAGETVKRVNLLIVKLSAAGRAVENCPVSKTPVTSGWRPPEVNANTQGAAPRSNHMTCLACDLYDPEGIIDDWCMNNLDALKEIGLWLEHPSSTKGWCHIQIVPPHSGNRVFYP